jgi:glycosyltransferase involved in cell wall biosynthesis
MVKSVNGSTGCRITAQRRLRMTSTVASPPFDGSQANSWRRKAALLSIGLNIGRRWSKPESLPTGPVTAGTVRLNAVISTWHEADIIASTVANAFTQGCERVFIVDNDSPDNTTAVALEAGAEIARVYSTEYWDEGRRISEVSRVIDRISTESGAEHVWWLICDADELPHGPSGLTIAEYLARLDQRFRIVGARVFNHYPSGVPAHIRGTHPLDFQPLCQEVRVAWCSLRHWKHPLMRWDRNGVPVYPRAGLHKIDASVQLIEPTEGIFLHHFQYRERENTQERLRRLCEDQGSKRARSAFDVARQGHDSDAIRRLVTLDNVYENRWSVVERPTAGGQRKGVQPKPWELQVPANDAVVARWYSDSDLR